jgi:hypothetical protein
MCNQQACFYVVPKNEKNADVKWNGKKHKYFYSAQIQNININFNYLNSKSILRKKTIDEL